MLDGLEFNVAAVKTIPVGREVYDCWQGRVRPCGQPDLQQRDPLHQRQKRECDVHFATSCMSMSCCQAGQVCSRRLGAPSVPNIVITVDAKCFRVLKCSRRVPDCEEWPGAAHGRRDQRMVDSARSCGVWFVVLVEVILSVSGYTVGPSQLP